MLLSNGKKSEIRRVPIGPDPAEITTSQGGTYIERRLTYSFSVKRNQNEGHDERSEELNTALISKALEKPLAKKIESEQRKVRHISSDGLSLYAPVPQDSQASSATPVTNHDALQVVSQLVSVCL